MLCKEIVAENVVRENDLCKILCYPSDDKRCCSNRLEELEKLGIINVYSFGDVQIGRDIWVIGKGHAAVIALAQHKTWGLVALKIRRIDSKRDSLEGEAKMLEIAHRTGYTPILIAYSKDIIVRQYINGSTLEKILRERSVEDVRRAIISLVKGAAELDKINVDITEITNPTKQVIYACNNMEKPIFVDLETARLHPNPSNTTRVISFVLRSKIGNRSLTELLSIENGVYDLIELGKQYKKALDVKEKEKIVDRILYMLLKTRDSL